ncbi:helix-turn-helix transcriptional regulator [Cellulomonas sp.]|uniref:helix-turn-helix domain-containing protein n=1 Tax=Cellulomonas sp. TaxID=40001 RepID=UPI001B0DF1F8|nr:helix-turn-helix transcriptional regulator [Cellulomonas sp.]MBO9556728.1 helix-turn-helix transcriptional regulator [Cellulomonas sp.]
MTALPPATLRLRTDVLRAAMASHGVRTQEQLAQEIGVGRATVVRGFSGRKAPGDALIAGLRLRLGLSLDDFVEVVPARSKP